MDTRRSRRAPAEVVQGVRLLVAGLRTWGTSPRLMARGALPALLTAVVFGVAFVMLVANIESLGHAAARQVVREGPLEEVIALAVGLGAVAAAALVMVATFTAVTLLVGQPFFESISREVDRAHGGLEGHSQEEHWRRALVRGIGEGLLSIAISLAVSLALLLLGLLPVVGSVAAFCVGAVVGGRLIALELVGYPLARRGLHERRARIAALRSVRVRAIAFGACVFLVFLIPLGAVIATPAAVVGGTLLARDAVAAGAR